MDVYEDIAIEDMEYYRENHDLFYSCPSGD